MVLTVKELIDKLNTMNQNGRVFILNPDWGVFDINQISEVGDLQDYCCYDKGEQPEPGDIVIW